MAKDTSVNIHWADQWADNVIKQKGNKKKYVCAAGITPSGTIHIGNFREIITVEIVARALKDKGKNVRFIYSWDDYDVFRKVPANMPEQEMLKKHLRKSIIDVPDPFKDNHESYAHHHEVEIEESVKKVGIKPEYLYQAKKYRALTYADGIRTALQKNDQIKEILNKFRKEPLSDEWVPVLGYCPDCNFDRVKFSNYDGNNKITMTCLDCKKDHDVDIRKAPFLSIRWRIDWPMRWAFEKVDFEPAGKEHYTKGGSRDTCKEIVPLFDWTEPVGFKYDFIIIKGAGGKMSSSLGNVITLKDVLEIYEPDMIRWFFVSTRPNTEFAISFDLDVIKFYEQFDKLERIYFKEEKVSEKEYNKHKRTYELSCVDKIPKKLPFQPSFRHLTNVLLVHELDVHKSVDYYIKQLKNKQDKDRLLLRATCAKNWLEKYAPDDFKYTVQKAIPKGLKLDKKMKDVLKEVSKRLASKDWNEKDLHLEFYVIVKNLDIEPKEFFKSAYKVLINKERGPKLASFMLTIGKDRVTKLFNLL